MRSRWGSGYAGADEDPSHHRAFNLVARRSASKHPADLYPARSRADRIFVLDERLTRQFGKKLAMLTAGKQHRDVGTQATQHSRIYTAHTAGLLQGGRYLRVG